MKDTSMLNGNQKRFLADPPTRDVGNGQRLVFAYTDAQLRVVRQLEALGFLKRYPSTSGYWILCNN
jgi:hypothetical protein